jgi:hypothetical protein
MCVFEGERVTEGCQLYACTYIIYINVCMWLLTLLASFKALLYCFKLACSAQVNRRERGGCA